MRQIIGGRMYDTEKAKLIYTTNKLNYPHETGVYRTDKGNFFLFHINRIEPVTETHTKNIIGQLDTDKYVELFGEPEEA